MSNRRDKWLMGKLHDSYIKARKNKRKTEDEQRFERDLGVNLYELRQEILAKQYHPGAGVAFIVRDPVIREIVAAPFRDRTVHHFLFDITSAWWDPRLSADSYSCRKGKGTLYGQRRLMSHIRKVSKNYKEDVFVAKLDIQGYFMSLNHDLLFKRVKWGLEQQFFHPKQLGKIVGVDCCQDDVIWLYHLMINLWREIIYDLPMKKVRVRGRREDWRGLPPNKSLFNQPKTQGLVIGNLTSQLLSNIFLDQLDRFVTIELGYKHYGRYVDDFYIVVPMSQREQLLRDVKQIEDFLRDTLKLTLHPKKRYFQVARKGIPFIGAVIFPGYIVPSKRTRRKAYAAAEILATTGEGVENFGPRMGGIQHINARKFWHELFDKYAWDSDWDEVKYKVARVRGAPRRRSRSRRA